MDFSESFGKVKFAQAAEHDGIGRFSLDRLLLNQRSIHQTVVANESDQIIVSAGGGFFEIIQALLDFGSAIGVGGEGEIGTDVFEFHSPHDLMADVRF